MLCLRVCSIQENHPNFDEEKSVQLLDELSSKIGLDKVSLIKSQIKNIVAETFAALSGETSVFMALPNCFELYGFDFLVDENYSCYLLGPISKCVQISHI